MMIFIIKLIYLHLKLYFNISFKIISYSFLNQNTKSFFFKFITFIIRLDLIFIIIL